MRSTMTLTTTTTILLARHGQSETNHQGLVTGQLDVGLSDKGHEQARALARDLDGMPLAAIYTSALRRTLDTARPTAAATGLPIAPLATLDEIHMGDLQGRFRDERDPAAQALWAKWQADPWHFCVPGGERFDAFADRVDEALRTIVERHRGQTVLIVGHRATNRVLLGTLMAWPRERWGEIRLRNKFFYAIETDSPSSIVTHTLSSPDKTGRRVAGFVM
jgi:broad specificity phosphatase PhoE